MSLTYVLIVCRALLELLLFDLRKTPPLTSRSPSVQPLATVDGPAASDIEREICEAVMLATCAYWKPVPCLQRSLCLARVLRAYGVPARVVIGYRAVPFFSHAWVQVHDRVVGDSPVYGERLQILHTM